MPDTHNVSSEVEKEVDEVEKEEVKSAKEVLQLIAKTTKTLKIYLPNNPIHQKFLADLKKKFDMHIETFGPLCLKIRQFELQCSGTTVYENINRMESLSFRLFIDGIREITFQEGLTPEEIIQFLEILGKDSDRAVDDDVVTLLWEKNFTHIQYRVAEGGQSLPGFDPAEIKSTDSVLRGEEQIRNMVQQETAGENNGDVAVAFDAPEGLHVEIPDLSIFQLTEEEVERIKQEVHSEEETDLVQKLQDILFDILRIETEPGLFTEVVGIVDNVLNILMQRGDFFHARRILEFYWEMTDPLKELPGSLSDRLNEAIQKAGDAGRIRALEPVLNAEGFDDIENFFAFLVLLEKNAVGPLADLLGHTAKVRTRRILCDALVELGKMDLDTVMSKVEIEDWYIVRNLIYVLGKIGDPRVLDVFHRLVHHREVKIRRELIVAIEGQDDPKVFTLLLKLLEDPDGAIRIAALKNIAKRNYKEAQGNLLNIVSQKTFEERELSEKKEFFSVLGRLGGDEVISHMRRILLQKRFILFRNIRLDEMGVCAVVALQRIGSPEAIEALKEAKRHANKTVRGASSKALELLGQVE